MEYFDNILCVTYKELLDIMPKGTLNSQLSREKLDVVSRGGGENNPALYAYSSLPEKYKKRWVERHGEPEKQMRQEMIRNIVKKDEKAENFFEDYRYDKNGEMVALPEDVKKEYTWNASVPSLWTAETSKPCVDTQTAAINHGDVVRSRHPRTADMKMTTAIAHTTMVVIGSSAPASGLHERADVVQGAGVEG